MDHENLVEGGDVDVAPVKAIRPVALAAEGALVRVAPGLDVVGPVRGPADVDAFRGPADEELVDRL
eukprot:1290058-Alexandrium_andersonii.AAC.1